MQCDELMKLEWTCQNWFLSMKSTVIIIYDNTSIGALILQRGSQTIHTIARQKWKMHHQAEVALRTFMVEKVHTGQDQETHTRCRAWAMLLSQVSNFCIWFETLSHFLHPKKFQNSRRLRPCISFQTKKSLHRLKNRRARRRRLVTTKSAR